jgi:hypothetical protein
MNAVFSLSGTRVWDNDPMQISRATWRWTALIGLWALVGAVGWLMAIQAFMVLIHASGRWQVPGIARVEVLHIERDEDSTFTDNLVVRRGGRERSLVLLKRECEDVQAGDVIWLLDNYYATPLRPAQFRLTPFRFLVEYPEPLLILALIGIWRIRRAQKRDQEKPPTTPKITLKDDFHARAQRFSVKPPESD